MISLGVVGTSGICEKFIAAAKQSGRFALTGVLSRDVDRGNAFAHQHGFTAAFTDIDAMAKAIDAVYIASPNLYHAPQSRLFLEKGVHVLCEKPIAVSLHEYQETKAIADQQGCVYQEAIIPRFSRERDTLLQALTAIGPLQSVDIRYHQRSSRLDAFLEGQTPNIFNMALHAGALMDLGIYCVYGAVDLLGKPQQIHASADFIRGCDIGGTADFDYGSFVAHLSWRKDEDADSISRFVGKNGSLSVKMISLYDGITLVQDGQTTTLSLPDNRITRMAHEALAFANLIEKNRNDSQSLFKLTSTVHECMDEIKKQAHIKYQEE